MKKKIEIVLIVLGLSLSLQKPLINHVEYNRIGNRFVAFLYSFFANYSQSFKVSSLIMIFLVIAVSMMVNKKNRLSITNTSVIQKIISIFLTFMTLVGNIYVNSGESLSVAFQGVVQSSKSILFLFSWYYIFEISQLFLINIVKSDQWEMKTKLSNSRVGHGFRKKPFFSSVITLSIMWLALLIINYPGIVMGDSLRQIAQIFGYGGPLRSDNPITSTIFISSFIKIGQLLGSPNFGLYLHSLAQSFLFILSLAFSIKWIQRFSNNELLTLSVTLLFGFLPILSSLINVATKDVLFSASFLVFVVSLSIYLYDRSYYWSHKTYLITILSIVFSILFRKNSLYVAILSLIILLISSLIRRSNKDYKIMIISLISIFFAVGLDSALIKMVGASGETLRRESLSVVFQQTARYAKEYDQEVTLEEKEVINKVLDYDKIKKVYNPRISDPVKATHVEAASSNEMKEYMGVWFNQFKKHPLVYFDATLHQNYSLFYLEENPNVYYLYLTDALRANDPDRLQTYEELGLKENKRVKELQLVKKQYYQFFDSLPILSQLNNVAFYIILMMMLLAISLREKKYKTIVLLVPIISLCLSLVAGPVVTGYIRYLIPFIMCGPLVFSFCLWENKKQFD